MRNHENELLRLGIVVNERHIDDLAIVQLMQGAAERRLAELRILLDVDDPEYLDLEGFAVRTEHANPLSAGPAHRPSVRLVSQRGVRLSD